MEHVISQLRAVVGVDNLIIHPDEMVSYTTNFRGDSAGALATVLPGNLVELWRVALVAVSNDLVVICQAANTSLTGGSTPEGEYERPVLIISTIRINKIQLINDNCQAVCFAGARLYELEEMLRPLGREPHSVLGSSCVGASVVGGICNNSGGALVRRGPAFTQYSLYAQVVDGELRLVNELGIDLGSAPEEILGNLEKGNYTAADISNDKAASATDYLEQVVQIDSFAPARFNSDPRRLYKASGSAGKLVVFAVRTDTFPVDPNQKTFYIAVNDPDLLTRLRRDILGEGYVPDQAEYMDAYSYDIADRYGREMHLIIGKCGVSLIPKLFRARAVINRRLSKIAFFKKYPPVDYVLEALNRLTPSRLSKRIRAMRSGNQHFLILCTSREVSDFVTGYLRDFFRDCDQGSYVECTPEESRAIQLHRFVIGNAGNRHVLLNRDISSGSLNIDIALPRNSLTFREDDRRSARNCSKPPGRF